MRKIAFILFGIFMLIALSIPSIIPVDAIDMREEIQQETPVVDEEIMQENYSVANVTDAFNALSHQGEWLGFHIGPMDSQNPQTFGVEEPDGTIAPNKQLELFPKPFDHHIQGMARSPNMDGPPIFYFSVSGTVGDENSFPGLLVVQMNSLAQHGERLGSNRLKRVDWETEHTSPPAEDKVIKIYEYDAWHPSGLAMVGDILAVPRGGSPAKGESNGLIKIIFYDCTEPANPVLLDYELVIKPGYLQEPLFDNLARHYVDEQNNLILDELRERFFVQGYLLSPDYVVEKNGDGAWTIIDGDQGLTLLVEGDKLVTYDARSKPQPLFDLPAHAWVDDLNNRDLRYLHDRFFIESDPPGYYHLSDNAILDIQTYDADGEPKSWIIMDDARDYSLFLEEDRLVVYDARFKIPWSHGAQAVAITRIEGEDGEEPYFLLVTNTGEGAHFHWSNSDNFNDDDFRFTEYLQLNRNDLKSLDDAGYWRRDKPIFQNLTFINEKSDTDESLFLIGALNTHEYSPTMNTFGGDETAWFGEDKLTLLKVENLRRPSVYLAPEEPFARLELQGISVQKKSVRSPGRLNDKEQSYYKFKEYICAEGFPVELCLNLNKYQSMRWQANFTAGATAYVSPLGELLYYGVSHWADGNPGGLDPGACEKNPGDCTHDDDQYISGDFAKMAEFSHKKMTAAENAPCGEPIYYDDRLGGTFTIKEGSDPLELSAKNYMIEPWVRMYQSRTPEIRQSVTMDWRTQWDDDYDNFSLLDGTRDDCHDSGDPGFANCMSSLYWCGPKNSQLTVYDDKWFGQLNDGEIVSIAFKGGGTASFYRADWGYPGLDDFEDMAESVKITWWNSQDEEILPWEMEYSYEWKLNGTASDRLVPDPENPSLVTYTPGLGGTTDVIKLTYMGEYEISTTYEIENEPPSMGALLVDPSTISEGQELTLNGWWHDGGSEHVTLSVEWGDGLSDGSVIGPGHLSSEGYSGSIAAGHVYADNGTFTISTAISDGQFTVYESIQVTIENAPPVVEAGLNQTIDEGDLLMLAPASFSDPGFDCPTCAVPTVESFSATVDWGDRAIEPTAVPALIEMSGSPGVPTQGTVQASHTYAGNGAYTVEVCVADDDFAETCDSFVVTVANVAPEVNAGEHQTIFEGDWVVLDPAMFSDPGFDCRGCMPPVEESFTATVDWGDGMSEPQSGITVTKSAGSEGVPTMGKVVASHQYLAPPGVYMATICVDDGDAQGCDTIDVTVVHGFMRFCAYADDENYGLTFPKEGVAACAESESGLAGEMRTSGLGSRGKLHVEDDTIVGGLLVSLSGNVHVGQDADITETITAGHDVSVDKGSHIHNSISAGHRVTIKQDVLVDGDITAVDKVSVDSRATVTGAIKPLSSVPPIPAITFVEFSFEPGSEKVMVEGSIPLELTPGVYKDVKVKKGATLILAGDYVFKQFEMEKDSILQIDLSAGPVVVDVAENLSFEENVQVQIASSGDARDILFRVAGKKVDLKKDGNYLGTFLAPNAEVKLAKDTNLVGALFGKKVEIDEGALVEGKPARALFVSLFVTS